MSSGGGPGERARSAKGDYAFMYRVVIPLSALPPRPPGIPWPAVIDEIFAHIFLVGLPVALLAARSARSR
jgi:hypothetical protein